jgi:hypothetical protein
MLRSIWRRSRRAPSNKVLNVRWSDEFVRLRFHDATVDKIYICYLYGRQKTALDHEQIFIRSYRRAFISQCEAQGHSIAVKAEVKQVGFLTHQSLMPIILEEWNT